MGNVFSNFEVPPSLTLTTGGEEERKIIDQRDVFFARVIGHLGLWSAHNAFISYETRALSTKSEALFPGENMRRSDNWEHELHVFDEVIALVLDRRNDGNYHQVSFLVGEPSKDVLARIQIIKQVSGSHKPTQNPS